VIPELAAEPELARILEAGRLAPSTYNTQPWSFMWLRSEELVRGLGGNPSSERWLLIVEDETRRIPVADPAAAETALSLGTCLANQLLAGRAAGWRPTVVPAEEADGLLSGSVQLDAGARPAALVRWATGGPSIERRSATDAGRLRVVVDGEPMAPPGAEGLLDHGHDMPSVIASRRSERSPYTGKPIEAEVTARAWSAAADLLGFLPDRQVALYVTSAPERLARAKDILFRTTHKSLKRLELAREAASWFRHSRASASRTGDGEPLDAAGIQGLELWLARRALNGTWGPHLLRLGGARRIASRNSGGVTSSALLMLWACRVEGDSPWRSGGTGAFMAAGCAVEGAWLSLAADGVGVQFMTPCLLFEESRRELAELFGLEADEVPLTLQRAGYPADRSGELPIRRSLAQLVGVA
jgi:nitroreductase